MKATLSLLAARTPRPFRKLRLTTKDINKGYYKGTGSGSMGWHTKFGGYKIDLTKVRTYVVPADLNTSKLTPFVTEKMRPSYGKYSHLDDPAGPRSAKLYLERWKMENGLD